MQMTPNERAALIARLRDAGAHALADALLYHWANHPRPLCWKEKTQETQKRIPW